MYKKEKIDPELVSNETIEEWKEIPEYEGLYQVSNLGNVKSLNYRRTGKEKILKALTSKDGYLYVVLCKDGKQKRKSIQQLVATAFIPNPEGKPCVDHINTDKSDNRVENLRWCTHKENINNPITLKKNSEAHKGEKCYWYGKTGKRHPNSKTIMQYTLDAFFVKEWENAYQIERELGFRQANICMCCKGKLKKCYGYLWRYKESA